MHQTPLNIGWKFVRADQENARYGSCDVPWLSAQAPGCVHLDLMAAGVIADPHQQMRELGCQWVDEADWVYETTFSWSGARHARQVLRFEGLDTIAEIDLNGERLGETDNMFIPHEFEVGDRLKVGENTLRVTFRSAARVGRERMAAFFERERLDETNSANFYDRSFVRKAQYMFGWDWGPRLVSCGIWKPVTLLDFDARVIDVDPRYEINDSTITLTVSSVTEGDIDLSHTLTGMMKTLSFKDGETVQLSREDFQLWSPDEPNVYELTTFGSDGAVLSRQRVGFRRIELRRESDAYGESFEFVLNGAPLWAMGANWIPDHSFPTLYQGERTADRLVAAKAMGMNMIRVWGGGFYESETFYDLCDQLGILVWQDFPFACAFYPDDPESQETLKKEAAHHIQRLKKHPCLALWCGNNENLEMFENRWGGDRTPPRYYGEKLYDETLPTLLAALNPEVPYIPSSPIGEPPAEDARDAKRRGPNSDGYGDQHNWDVWHGRGDWRFYTESQARFQSEYGFASAPSMLAWERTFHDPARLSPRDPAVVWHDKTLKGTDTFHGFVELHYPKSETLEEWTYYSQLNQRDALRHGIEHYRRSEFCKGSLIWQLNDCWPVQSWSVIDSEGAPKALAYELKRLYAPVLLSLVRDKDRFELYVTGDTTRLLSHYRLRVRSIRTSEVWREIEVRWENGRVGKVAQIGIEGLPANECLITVEDSMDNVVTFRLGDEPKAMKWPRPAPIHVSRGNDGDSLRVVGDQPIVDLCLTSDRGEAASIHDDNFVTLVSGRLEGHWPGAGAVRARSLAGVHPVKITRGPV